MKRNSCIFGTPAHDHLNYINLKNGRLIVFMQGSQHINYKIVRSNNHTGYKRRTKSKIRNNIIRKGRKYGKC